jgi:hypothetical protein
LLTFLRSFFQKSPLSPPLPSTASSSTSSTITKQPEFFSVRYITSLNCASVYRKLKVDKTLTVQSSKTKCQKKEEKEKEKTQNQSQKIKTKLGMATII